MVNLAITIELSLKLAMFNAAIWPSACEAYQRGLL